MKFKRHIKELLFKLYIIFTPIFVYILLPYFIKALKPPAYLVPNNVVLVAVAVLLISLVFYLPIFIRQRQTVFQFCKSTWMVLINLVFEKSEDSTKGRAL